MKTLLTIGHSNRELDAFLVLLHAEQIEHLADVRRFPGSRRHPQFGRDALAAALHDAGIAYSHFPDLGGRRTTRRGLAHFAESAEQNVPVPLSTQNTAWRVAAFAAYADYMLTEEFTRACEELTAIASQSRTAIMCAEALPWQCHRRLIADHFTVHGWRVRDIVGPNQIREHALPPFASVNAGQLTYPA